MKKLFITTIIALLTAGWNMAGAQEFPEEYLGLPGDNLNLYAVMKLFQESETLEGFERKLNDENSRVNNLDLNGDNLVDYLMVMDYRDGNVHTIVLRAALNRNETQDVAVFTVNRFNDGSVQIQLVGDEALYGKNYIVEPIYAEAGETPNPGYLGTPVSNRKVQVVRTTTYEVAAWPLITFIYRPAYVVWRSSWHWGYYPDYWNPWRPFYWHTYYGYHYNWHSHYYAHYRPWHHHRHSHYNAFYYNKVRTYSPTVVINVNKGNYRNTYSRPDLRNEGERLYARTNSTRSSANTSARVRTTGSGTAQKSALQSGSSSGRRSSTVATGRSATNRSTEIRTGTSQRSVSGASGRAKSGNSVSRSTDIQRKSATISGEKGRRQSPAVGTPPTVRKETSSSSARKVTRSSASSPARVSQRPASPARQSSTPAVRQSRVQKAPASVSSPARPAQTKSAVKRSSPVSSFVSKPAVRSSRSVRQEVQKAPSASRSSAATSPAKRSRSSSGSSGRR